MRLYNLFVQTFSVVVLLGGFECKGGRGGGRGAAGRRGGSSRGRGSSPGHSHSGHWLSLNLRATCNEWLIFSGAPPAYPGLAHHPGSVHPPAYSPNHINPPAYSPGFTKNVYKSNQIAYGSQFGKSGLSGNTYIANNYYGVSSYGRYRSSGSSFLTNALFFGVGMRHGHYLGRSNANDRESVDDLIYN